MKVISTATNISQAFKNVGRVTEILSVLVSHGFADIIHRMQLTRFLPAKYFENPRYKNLPTHERLRLSFEELGPTFVKLGQLLATRADLLPEAYVEEFQKLQDRVATVPYPEIERFIESELRAPTTTVFKHFDQEPIAAASVAQVHGAQLKSGERVAVKVQRPGIERVIHNDISILRGLSFGLEKYIPESRPFNPTGVVDEFFKTILDELDFLVEANNIRRIRKNMANFPKVAIPEVFSQLSTNRVLILQRFEGIRFSDREAILKAGVNPVEIVEIGSDAFFHMVMRDGIFHGDLHAGNLFVLPDGRIGIIDFGIVGRLSRRVQDSITTMFIALIDEDFETLASEYMNLCQSTGEVDLYRLQKDLMDAISPYIGMPIGEANIGKILMRSTAIAARHKLQVPRELMLLFKAVVTIEALGKKLDPSFDILQVGTRLARQTLATRYSKERILRDLIVVGRDVQSLLEITPRLLKRFLKRWSANNFAVETRNKDIEMLATSIRFSSYTFALSMLSVGLVAIGITLLILNRGPFLWDYPLWAIISLGTGLWVLLYSIWILRKKIR